MRRGSREKRVKFGETESGGGRRETEMGEMEKHLASGFSGRFISLVLFYFGFTGSSIVSLVWFVEGAGAVEIIGPGFVLYWV